MFGLDQNIIQNFVFWQSLNFFKITYPDFKGVSVFKISWPENFGCPTLHARVASHTLQGRQRQIG
ncbi:unnamed protein product [Coffea canephora]|uniref:DH200=94 genomic scaffold, scaffold_163 n=1 Tax=Coffea canephora TaxID=49390 RepID=A0A068V9L6_COFCA|nr:unnamed protein product [Coffea canephora]